MLFYSIEFILLFPLVCIVYYLLPYNRRWVWLLAASYFFYAYSNWTYLIVLLISTTVDFYLSHIIFQSKNLKQRKILLTISISLNLAWLFFFKYFNFLTHEMTSVFQYLNLHVEALQHDFLLPPGISFYTFQAMSYIIDVYRGRLEPERHFGRFALWVAFFPQLIAGPIERASQLLPQFHFRYNADYDRVRAGATRFLWGLFKKLVVADNLALLVSPVFAEPSSYHGLVVWVAAVLFLYQLFYDFSAYADMAVGLGMILGIRLSENFTHRLAWMSSSFAELWRNWHITLTIWIRDYIYVPLAKVIRHPWLRRFLPLLTFTLMGIWHGAGWNFVVWGVLNGLYFTAESWLRELRLNNRIAWLSGTWTRAFTNSISSVLVFTLSTFAIVFFRAENYADALTLLHNGFQPVVGGFGYLPWFDATVALTALALAEAIRLALKNRTLAEVIGHQHIAWRMLIYVGILESILLFAVPGSQKFIYFQF